MAQLRNFIRTDLESGHILCEDVHLSSGTVCTVYLSTSSVYVLSYGTGAPALRYRQVQDILGTIRIRLYLLNTGDGCTGVYDDLTDTVGLPLDQDALSADIYDWLIQGRSIYDAEALERLVSRLKSADIKARGYYIEDDGQPFILRHGKLHKASPVSSERQFYLTLFTGPLGFHRFALGKFLSGIAYFLTCGFFLVGWLLDLIQLFVGAQKDRKKRYLFPLADRKRKLLILPLGLLTGFLLFLAYSALSNAFGFGIQNLISHEVNNTDPQTIRDLAERFSWLFTQ